MTHSTISGTVQSIHHSIEDRNYKYVLRVNDTELSLSSNEVLAINPGDLITATGQYKGPRFEVSAIRNEITNVTVSNTPRAPGCILTFLAAIAIGLTIVAISLDAPFFFLLALVPGGMAAFGFINVNNHQKAAQALATTPRPRPTTQDPSNPPGA